MVMVVFVVPVTLKLRTAVGGRAHPIFGSFCGALKCPAMQEQFATATPLVVVLAGHGTQESEGSKRER